MYTLHVNNLFCVYFLACHKRTFLFLVPLFMLTMSQCRTLMSWTAMQGWLTLALAATMQCCTFEGKAGEAKDLASCGDSQAGQTA